ncbi:helix-turn-helix domain-containing protein [Vagococcus fessus]|uniref:HTH cro/C1-type domain-containing protein n=1 Tax=Vagococcus fessus TaxID=120370 RepID=A0A430A7H7_9ENTE|nr:helix-turn-helix transcriptional regulator [Vagococcus fessus]RSU03060.1 hypothetical protein CBF31_04910 [Vagococcus fessus]
MSVINKRISSARKASNMTQQELADKLNVSRSTISNWEVGRNYPDLDMIVELSDIFNLSLDSLLREDTEMIQEVSKEQRNGKKRKWWIAGLTSALIISFVILGMVLKESTNFFHYFSPVKMVMVNKEENELDWHTATFYKEKFIGHSTGEDYFVFNSIFYDQEIINDSDEASPLSVKISDYETGKVVAEFDLKPAESRSLKQLKRQVKYKLELRGRESQLMVNII